MIWTQSHLRHLLAESPWESNLTTLSINFLVYQISFTQGVTEIVQVKDS
jgi:hypothetical protein